jgi:hypothetical protein
MPDAPRRSIVRLIADLNSDVTFAWVTQGVPILLWLIGFYYTVRLFADMSQDTTTITNTAFGILAGLSALSLSAAREYLSCPIGSSYPMSQLSQAPDKSVKVYSIEFGRGKLQPQVDDAKVDLGDVLEQQWTKYYLPILIRFNSDNQRFFFALHSYDASRFAEDERFALATLWTGIESLFSPGGAELSFKMAAAWASFLEPFGPKRNSLRKEISTLYNVRSKAVHGQPLEKYNPVQALQRTRELLRLSLCKLLEEEMLPEVEDLMERIFE